MQSKETEAIKLALDLATMHHSDDGYQELRQKVRRVAKAALAEQPAQPQQEPVYFCDYGYEGWEAWSIADGEHNASASVKRRITRAIEAAHQIGVNK